MLLYFSMHAIEATSALLKETVQWTLGRSESISEGDGRTEGGALILRNKLTLNLLFFKELLTSSFELKKRKVQHRKRATEVNLKFSKSKLINVIQLGTSDCVFLFSFTVKALCAIDCGILNLKILSF